MSISLPTEHIQKFTRTYEVTAMYFGPHTTPAELLAFAPNFRPAVWMPEARGWLISRGDTGVMWVDPNQFEREFTPTPEKRETDEHPSTQGTQESGRQVRPDTETADEVHPDEASDDAAPPARGTGLGRVDRGENPASGSGHDRELDDEEAWSLMAAINRMVKALF
jgi:hypothetical protein